MSNLKPLSIAATGANITTSGTSAHAAIPNALDGNKPKYCTISATAACHVRWGKGTQTAVATDMLLNPNTPPVAIDVSGCDDIAAIQDSTGGTLNVAPLEWAR